MGLQQENEVRSRYYYCQGLGNVVGKSAPLCERKERKKMCWSLFVTLMATI